MPILPALRPVVGIVLSNGDTTVIVGPLKLTANPTVEFRAYPLNKLTKPVPDRVPFIVSPPPDVKDPLNDKP